MLKKYQEHNDNLRSGNGGSGSVKMAKQLGQTRGIERAKGQRGKKEMRKKKKQARILTICIFFIDRFFAGKELMK